ncbi:unnamed protein product [Blepharisma stoltei]|uniref:Calmodulin n=1 Tax=Blepharisma stoltei TaxID=1481888 RepID=A0AAU9J5F2_9CILI|nr:unnamed protein product [Blepharisma stoltei]
MSVKLTAQEESDVKDVILIYGNTAAQTIPTNMLGPSLRALKLNPLESEIVDFITEFDRDGSGTLTYDQFVKIYSRKKVDSDTLDELLAAFRLLDREGEGNIPVPEFRYYICRMGERMNEADCDEMVKAADPENSGKVNIEKFAKFLLGIKDENK